MVTPDELLGEDITIFKDRVRIDVRTHSPGMTFDSAWPRRAVKTYHGQERIIAALENLIASKKAAAQPIDLEDIRMLEAGQNANRQSR